MRVMAHVTMGRHPHHQDALVIPDEELAGKSPEERDSYIRDIVVDWALEWVQIYHDELPENRRNDG